MGSTLGITQHHHQRLWGKGWLLASRAFSIHKKCSWGAILQEDTGRVLYLRTVCLELSDLLYQISALVFNPCVFLPWTVDRSGMMALAWVCVLSVCIFKWGNWTVENTATCCIHAMEKGEMRQFTVNSFKQSFRVMVTVFASVSLESHSCLFIANRLLC